MVRGCGSPRLRAQPRRPALRSMTQAGDTLELALDALVRGASPVAASAWPGAVRGLDAPGLYAWHVSDAGAVQLSRGLGLRLSGGLLYVGQAGAHSAGKGKPSSATLRSRISANHLRGNVRASTLRCTLAGILAGPLGLAIPEPRLLQRASEARLSEWIGAELSIAVWPASPGVPLGAVEKEVVQTLRPPLNRSHLPPDALRERLRERRAVVTHGIDDLWVAPDPGLTGWRQILAEYGQAFDGYRYARLVRRRVLPELADEVWRLRAEKGQFCSDFADLRCALFWLQRCVRNAEQSPGWRADEDLERHVAELFGGVLDAWHEATQLAPGPTPEWQ